MGNNLDRSRLVSVIEQCLENEGNKFLNNCALFYYFSEFVFTSS